MGIKKWLVFVVLSYNTISLTAAQRDSIVIDKRWNRWHVESVSSNGEWTFAYQTFQNDYNRNRAFVIDTDAKRTIEVTGLNYYGFTTNNILLGKKINEIVEVDLKSQKQTVLGTLKQQDWVEESQTLCYITEKNELVLRNYQKNEAIDLMTVPEVTKYYISPSKTQLLYQKEGSGQLYVLNIKSGKEKFLMRLDTDLSAITWNLEEKAVVVPINGSKIQFIDLKEEQHKLIEISSKSEEGVVLNISFFPNDDIYLERFIETKNDNPEKEYVDIWNGNDRELKYKVLPKWEGIWSTFIYHQNTNKLSQLQTHKKQKYWNIVGNNYLLVYEPLELQDYSTYMEKVRYRILNLKTMQELGDLTTVSDMGSSFNKSLNHQYLVYPKGEDWEVYDFKTHGRLNVPHKDRYSKPIWSSDSKWVFYSNGQNLMKLNVVNGKSERITQLTGENHFSFENENKRENSVYIDFQKPFLFSIRHTNNNMSYYSLFKDKVTTIVDNTPNRLNLQYLKQGISEDGNTAVWTEENYNLPPTVKVFRKGKVSTLLEAEVPKELYSWRKQKVIHYKDKYGVDLTGVLWYPKDFNPSKKYPMITWIYELQGAIRSVFEHTTPLTEAGFNRTLLNEQGYFVFMPDTYVSEEGPGLSALECVTKGIEAITLAEPTIDKVKLGLMGHSFGGYKTSFILSQSKLFVAGVSGSGIHDLINYTYEYNYALNKPNYFRVEGPQQDFRVSFGENPTKYYKNSPIHFAQNFEASMLIWTGMEDDNVHWENSRHMYVALQRYKKPVIALFYQNEGHSLNKKKEQLDLNYRVLDWFDYYLKRKKKVEWIVEGIDYVNY